MEMQFFLYSSSCLSSRCAWARIAAQVFYVLRGLRQYEVYVSRLPCLLTLLWRQGERGVVVFVQTMLLLLLLCCYCYYSGGCRAVPRNLLPQICDGLYGYSLELHSTSGPFTLRIACFFAFAWRIDALSSQAELSRFVEEKLLMHKRSARNLFLNGSVKSGGTSLFGGGGSLVLPTANNAGTIFKVLSTSAVVTPTAVPGEVRLRRTLRLCRMRAIPNDSPFIKSRDLFGSTLVAAVRVANVTVVCRSYIMLVCGVRSYIVQCGLGSCTPTPPYVVPTVRLFMGVSRTLHCSGSAAWTN